MRRHRGLRVLKIALIALLAATVFGFAVMFLWNWLMPGLFGLHPIGFWRALGLVALSKIMFGGFHGRPGCGGRWRQRVIERWEQMTPEERERFRAGMRSGCGPFGSSTPTPKPE